MNEPITCDKCNGPLTAEEIEVPQWQFETEDLVLSVMPAEAHWCEECCADMALEAAGYWVEALQHEG